MYKLPIAALQEDGLASAVSSEKQQISTWTFLISKLEMEAILITAEFEKYKHIINKLISSDDIADAERVGWTKVRTQQQLMLRFPNTIHTCFHDYSFLLAATSVNWYCESSTENLKM